MLPIHPAFCYVLKAQGCGDNMTLRYSTGSLCQSVNLLVSSSISSFLHLLRSHSLCGPVSQLFVPSLICSYHHIFWSSFLLLYYFYILGSFYFLYVLIFLIIDFYVTYQCIPSPALYFFLFLPLFFKCDCTSFIYPIVRVHCSFFIIF